MKVDWLFKNVTVIDGSGGPQYRADVAVKGDPCPCHIPQLAAWCGLFHAI